MTKKFFTTAGLMLICLSTTLKAAQFKTLADGAPDFKRVEFGFRFMPTISAFTLKNSSGNTIRGEATFGYGLGGMLAFNFSKHMGIQGEVIYNSLSQKYRDQEMDREINVNYLNIPLLFSLNTSKSNPVNLNFVIGPQMGVNMGSSIKKSGGNNSDTVTYVLATKKSDFGFAYGAGFEFMLNEIKTIRMDLGFRGVYGLVNINNKEQPRTEGEVYIVESAKVRTNSVYMGLSFLF